MRHIEDREGDFAAVQLRGTEMVELFKVAPKEDPHGAMRSCGVGTIGTPEWYGGVKTQDEMDALVTSGWTDGREKLASVAQSVQSEVTGVKSRKRKAHFSDSDGELQPERALSGDWDVAFRTVRREWAPGVTHIDLACDWGGSGRCSAEELFFSGAVALILTDRLEDAGFSVRLTLNMTSRAPDGVSETHRHITQVVLKEHGEPLDMDGLATLACHAGAYRSYGFRTIFEGFVSPNSSFGKHVDLGLMIPALESHGLLEPGAIHVSGTRTVEEAAARIREVLSRVTGDTV